MKLIDQGACYALAISLTTALMTVSVSANELVDVQTHKAIKVSYDWHSNAQKGNSNASRLSAKERKRLAIMNPQHGRGSYICSPSGFGRLSRCHRR